MKRVAAGPAGAPPIVGTWTWTDDDTPALTQWERYGTDGTMSRRIPGAAASGRYEADAGTLRRVSDTGERTEEPFRIQGDLLSLTDSWGTTRRFAWAGEKAWYEWFTMPVVPPQPR